MLEARDKIVMQCFLVACREYPTRDLHFVFMTYSPMYTEKSNHSWDISQHATRKPCITIM